MFCSVVLLFFRLLRAIICFAKWRNHEHSKETIFESITDDHLINAKGCRQCWFNLANSLVHYESDKLSCSDPTIHHKII